MELLNLVEVAWAADALQVGKIAKLSWADIRKHTQKLELFGEILPAKTQQLISGKHCQEMLAAGNVEGWTEASWPVCEPGEEKNDAHPH